MIAKPPGLLRRDGEWSALCRFVERGQRLALVYGPRRIGKSFLLDALCEATGGFRYQAITGVAAAQLDDFGHALGAWLGVGALALRSWSDALDRLSNVSAPVIVIDELPYLTASAPELTGALQRHVDTGRGPSLILAGSSLSTMTDLVGPKAPLYGRAAAVVVPRPFAGPSLSELWGLEGRPTAALWVDAAVGGLPGYRPLLDPPGEDLDAWMVDEVLAASSPLLDAAEAALADTQDLGARGVYRTVLSAVAAGERFSGIARVAGQPTGALTRPLATLEHAGLLIRVPDPLRARRDTYDLADPHLRTWLTIIEPHRSQLLAGRARPLWDRVRLGTWRAQVLGPRWESVTRDHVAGSDDLVGPVDAVGVTVVADRTARKRHEIDLVATRDRTVVALGEAKLRPLGPPDLDRLRRVRDLLGATAARLVLASATGVDAVTAEAPDELSLGPADVYS